MREEMEFVFGGRMRLRQRRDGRLCGARGGVRRSFM